MTPNMDSNASPRFSVLGAGTWGLTLADLLARNGYAANCWDIDSGLLDRIRSEHTHPKLPEFQLDERVELIGDLAQALGQADAAVLVVPSRAMRSACRAIAAAGMAGRIGAWILCTKGIEQESLMLMHEVLADVLGPEAGGQAAVLSGPSHAEEVSRSLPATVVACAADPELATRVQRWFFRPYLRVYTHDDMKGVELGGSLKNVIAIAAGALDGLGMGDNARAALMTRGLAEIVRLGLAMGARLETFMGLSGIGDLIVTAASRHSRNHNFGELLAHGTPVDQALEKIGMVVEGYPTAESAMQLARRHKVPMPITEAVYGVLYEGLSPRQAVEDLMARDPKPEHY